MPVFNSGQDVIKAFMRSLDNTTLKGQAALDEAVRACSNYSGINDLINNFISDCQNSSGGDNFLRNYCGIILDNNDTGAITGSDAGGSITKTADSIVPEYGSMQTFTGTSFSTKGLNVTVPSQSSMNNNQKTVVNGLYSWWVTESLNLIEESYGSNFGFGDDSSATVKDMRFYFTSNALDSALATTHYWYYTDPGNTTRLEMDVNMYYCNSFSDSVNGQPGGDYSYLWALDRTLSHEFTHAVMTANIRHFYALPQFISEGMAELTHGIDDARIQTINKLANNPTALREAVNVDDTGTLNADCYAGGYMLLRYLAKQASGGGGEEEEPAANDESIVNSKSDTVVYGTGEDDSISNTGSRATIIAGSGDDIIDNRADRVIINGGAGNDSINSSLDPTYGWFATINGGLGNDTVTGSNYADEFVYSSGDGHDVITNYGENDTIRINTGTVDGTVESGNDVIISIGSGSITLKNARGKALNLVDGNDDTIRVGDSGTPESKIIYNVETNAAVNGTGDDDTINNAAGGVKIFGGAGNDSIFNSTSSSHTINNAYGYVTVDAGDGNDSVVNNDPYVSINGGAGDDYINTGDWRGVTIRGGAGNDSIRGTSRGTWYQYAVGDGYDTIENYSDNDTIQITSGTVVGTVLSGSDMIINLGSGSIRLLNADNKALNLVNASKTRITLGGDTPTVGVLTNTTKNTVVSGTTGNDTITNRAGGVKIFGGNGNDSIFNSTSDSYTINNSYGYVTIDAGNGNDTVDSNDPYVSINGGAGNDSINTRSWNNVTVRGGTGNDTFTGSGDRRIYQYLIGDGSDVIDGYASDDSLQIMSGIVNSTMLSGDSVIVNVDGGSITLLAASDKNINLVDAYGDKIIIGSIPVHNDEIIINTNINSVVSGTSVADTIDNRAGGAKIFGGTGNDSIRNSTSPSYTINGGYGYVTIDAGDGNDTVDSSDPYVSISGGAGHDSIEVNGWRNVTVNGGTGNDTINGLGSSNIIQYKNGDGNDVIVGYTSSSTIRIADNSLYTTRASGDDVIVSLSSGSMTLKDAAGQTLNIIGGTTPTTIETAKSITNITKNTLVSGSRGDDTLRNRAGGVTIAGGAGNDSIYNSTSDNYTINNEYGYVTIDAGDGADIINSYDPYVSLNGGDGNDSINVNYYSCVTIRSGAGADTVINVGERNVLEYANGDGNDLVYGYKSSSTVRIVDDSSYETVANGSDVIISIEGGAITLNNAIGKTLNIEGGTYAGTTGGGGSDDFMSNRTRNTAFSGSSGADTMKNYAGGVTLRAGDGNDSIYNSTSSDYTINGSYGYVTIDAGAGNDNVDSNDPYMSINGGAGADSINVNGWRKVTVRGGAGNDYIRNVGTNNVIEYAAGDGFDTVDGFREDDTLRIVDGSSYSTVLSGDDVIVNVGSGSIRLINANGSDINIIRDAATVQPSNKIYNTTKNTLVSGTSAADSIFNSAGGVTLRAGSGNDYINNSTSSSYTINNGYGYVTIDAGDGNDTIYSGDPNVSINGGAGADSINANAWRKVTVRGGAGNDTVRGTGNYKVIEYAAGDGHDVINGYNSTDTVRILDSSTYTTQTSGDDVIINIGAGSITLKNAIDQTLNIIGGTASIDPSVGRSINNTIKNTVVNGGDGNDTIENFAGGVSIAGGDGNDSIHNSTGSSYTINNSYGYVTIDAGAGNDTVYNVDPNVSINGGAGADSIELNNWRNNTVRGGAGNDSISGLGLNNVIEYAGGDGFDIVDGYSSDDTVRILDSSTYTTQQSGSDVIINIGAGSITLKDAVDQTLNIIGGTASIDPSVGRSINNTIKNTVVNGGDGDDYINNRAGGVKIVSGAGNDSIYNSTSGDYTINGGYGYVTIDAGAGDDTVVSNDPYVSINGGAGNDSIYSTWRNVTINGGTGDDTVDGLGLNNIIQYKNGDGNDIVVGYNSNSTIRILDDSTYTTQTSGNDVIINIGTGSITLKDAVDQTLNIIGGTASIDPSVGQSLDNTIKNTVVSGGDGDDTISNSAGGVTLRAGDGNDVIYNSTFGDYTINGSYGYVTIDAGAGNDTVVSNDPYISINGGAGNDSINSTWRNVTINGGTGDDTVSGLGSRNVVQYRNGDGNDIVVGYNSDDTVRILDDSTYTMQTSGNDVIINIGAGSITLTDAIDKTINIEGGTSLIDPSVGRAIDNTIKNTVVSGGDGDDTISNSAGGVTLRADAGNDIIYNSTFGDYTINGSYGYVTIDAGAGNDTVDSGDPYVSINGGAGNDSIYSTWRNVTINGGTGDDSVSGLGTNNIIQYKNGDGNDIVVGYNSDDTVRILDGSTYTTQQSGSDVIINIGAGSITLKDAIDKTLNIEGGTSPIDPSVGRAIDNTLKNTVVSGGDGDDTIFNAAGGVTLRAGAGNDSIYSSTSSSYTINNSYGYVTIDAGAGDDTVDSYDSHVSINGGAGDDIIEAWVYSDMTMRGGEGNDTIHAYGNRNVFEYAAGDGFDIVDGYSSNSTVRILDDSTYTTQQSGSDVIINIGAGSITLTDAVDQTLNIVGGTASLDPTVGRAINNTLKNTVVSGGDGDDTISNSADVVTINGGAGDDTIDGLGVNNIIQYKNGDGNDIVVGYNSDDIVRILDDSTYTTQTSGNDVIINIGAGSITLKDAIDKTLNIVGGTASLDPTVGRAIDNTLKNTVVSGGDGDDTISNSADVVTINGGAGDDTIDGLGVNNIIQYKNGDGNDIVVGYNSDDIVRILDDSTYTTQTSGNDVIINIGAGSITLKDAIDKTLNIVGGTASLDPTVGRAIDNTIQNTVVNGGEGDDTIENFAGGVTLLGGDGNDSINAHYWNAVTMRGGAGDDTINGVNGDGVIEYASGDGNDVVEGFSDDATLRIVDDAPYSTLESDNDVVVSLDAGSITFKNAFGNMLNIVGGTNLTTTEPDNGIINTASNTLVSGTEGDDTITNSGDDVTIRGGAGDDVISLAGGTALIEYGLGDGNDLLANYGIDNTISITDDAAYSTVESGNDVIVSIEGGTLTVKDALGKTLNIVGGTLVREPLTNSTANTIVGGTDEDDTIENSGSGSTIYGGAGDDVISNTGTNAVIEASYGDDRLINSGTGTTLTAGEGNDTIDCNNGSGSVIRYATGDGNDVIVNYGISDMISLTDGADYSTLVGGNDVIVSIGSGSITVKDAVGRTLNIAGGTLIGETREPITNFESNTIIGGTDDDDTIDNDGSSVTIRGGAGDDYISVRQQATEVSADGGLGNDTIDVVGQFSTILGGDGRDRISDFGKDNVVDGGAGDDSIWSFGDNSTILGGAGDDWIGNDANDGYANVFVYAVGDGNDTIENYSNDDKISIADDAAYSTLESGNDVIINVGSGSITLLDAAGKRLNINGDDTTPAVEGLNVVNATASTVIVGTDEDDTITNTGARATIDAGDGEDSISNAGVQVRINAGAGDDYVVNSGVAVTIDGGDDDDWISGTGSSTSLNGGDGDDTIEAMSTSGTLVGGEGSDVFRIGLSNSSNNLSVHISDLNAEEDVLEILSGNTTGFTYSTLSGAIVLKDDGGHLNVTLDGVTSFDRIADVEVELMSDGGALRSTATLGAISTLAAIETSPTDGVKMNKSGKTLTLNSSVTGTLRAEDYSANVKTMNASKATGTVNLIGNDSANVLKASKGGGTLEGGGGKDKITCGAGADVIVYSDGDGKDTIKKFDGTRDKIVIAEGAIDSVKVKGKNVVLNIGSGSMTVQKAVGQDMTIVDESGVESTYRFTKQNNTLEKALISTDAQLSAEDYWFEQSAIDESPLSEILSTEATEISFTPESIFDIMARDTTILPGGLKCKRQTLR